MSRSPESVLHETDYWRALLEDLGTLNDQIQAAADQLIDGLPDMAFGDRTRALEQTGAAMKTLGEMHRPLHRVLDLALGRVKALEREVDDG